MDLHQHLFTHLELGSDSDLNAYIEADLPEYLAQYLAYGVTTIKSTGDFGQAVLSVRDRLARGALVGPRLYVVGPVFTAPGGHPAGTVCGGEPWCRERLTVELAQAGEAATAVQVWATRGVDAIKLVCDGFDGDLDLPKLDPPGLATLVELNQMVQCGATPMQALQAGTRDAAAHLGILDEVGTLEEGKLADLVILDGNPLERFDAIQQVEMTIQGGRIVVDKRSTNSLRPACE